MMDSPENVKLRKRKKFVLLAGQNRFQNEENSMTIELSEPHSNFDLLAIQFEQNHEGGTGFLFCNNPTGSGCYVIAGTIRDGDWTAEMRAYIRTSEPTTLHVLVPIRGASRQLTTCGVKAVYGIKF